MDIDDETRKLKFGVVVVGIFIVSTFFAWTELKFATRGTTTEATVDRLFEQHGRRGRSTLRVQYHYRNEAGELISASDRIPTGWQKPGDGKVMIAYVDGSSRLAGNRNTGALVVFFACLIAMLVGGLLFWRHVREATRSTSRGARPARAVGMRR